jgi:WD40 repeat protein
VLQPENDSWAAVVYDSASETADRLGTAVVIDGSRLLTAMHVIVSHLAGEQVWVAFPKATGVTHRDRWPALVIRTDPDLDVAVLQLTGDLPPGVTAPPLRCPTPYALLDMRWWAFGFAGSRRGNSAYGSVGESLGDGYVRIDADPSATYRLRPGFSGGGVWSPDFGAVVGVVVTADEHGNGEAVTLHQIDLYFPEEKLSWLAQWTASQAGETALAAWGWRLDRDPEGVRHWRPRGRGVSADSERGFRFRGRRKALTAITGWLDRKHTDRRALVVTGSPGAGKSAVLGRIVTTADPAAAAALPTSDQEVRATLGSVACAVHAKGKTALEVAAEIARAASAALPDQVEDFAPTLRAALAGRRRRFNVLIDALDEATDPDQARSIITNVILPLAETCADVGAQVIAGTRRSVGDVDLLAAFGESMQKLDLDDPGLFSDEDLTAYALAALRLEGDERVGNPYADEIAAGPVAARIAELSDRNFLVAGLTARAHGLHDQHAVDPASLTFTASVDTVMRQYLRRLESAADVPADAALTALAFAEAPGLSLELWQAAVQALGAGHLTTHQLARFARSPAASFLVESSADSSTAVFRLFHQALNDALLHARQQIALAAHDQRALTQAFITVGKQHGWDHASSYLLRSLPAHAAAGGMIDDLLIDDTYLLHADLRRLIPLADHATSQAGYQRSRLLRLTPRAITADPATRTAMFSVTETLENLGRSFTTGKSPAPYGAIWTTATPHIERSVLEGHTDWVRAVCAFTVGDRTLLASGGDDQMVRIWDPATGAQQSVLHGHPNSVRTVCAFTVGDRTLLASGGAGQVRIWDPITGTQQPTLQGHTDLVYAMCAFTVGDRALLAGGGYHRSVYIWDAATGAQQAVLQGHTGQINAVCAFTVGSGTLLASSGADKVVRIWDPASGTQQSALHGHTGWVRALCAFTMGGPTLLASGGADHTVRIWDPATGTQQATLQGHTDLVRAVCAFTVDGRTLLASGGDDQVVRIWDPATGTQQAALHGHPAWVYAMCAFTMGGRTLLASGGGDHTVRIWEPATSTQQADSESRLSGVNTVCTFTLDGHSVLASGGADRLLRIWDPTTGTQQAALHGHTGSILSVCAFTMGGRTLLASGGADQVVRIWNPITGTQHATLHGHTDWINAVCAFTMGGRTLLASGGDDQVVRIWDPTTGTQQAALQGHPGSVSAVCAFTVGGRTLLASGGAGVGIWDPIVGTQQAALQGHVGWVRAVCAFTMGARTLLASGGADKVVRIWDPATSTQQSALEGHTDDINTICAFTVDGRALLASGGDDCTIRIWDPAAATTLLTVPVYYPVRAVDSASDVLVITVTAGVIAIRFTVNIKAPVAM